jgi:lysophospholipase L1-like esterase
MRRIVTPVIAAAAMFAAAAPLRAEEKPLPQEWEYAAAMRKVVAGSKAREGVVLHVGDSITYSGAYGAWARGGKGQTAEDRAALAWMHTGKGDDSDGWQLARFDHPKGGRSHTACSGMRADELLAGGKRDMPPLSEMLKQYRPAAVVLMIGTNDVSAGRKPADIRGDVGRAVDAVLAAGAVCVLSTIPPHPGKPDAAAETNKLLRELAKSKSLPLIDFEREILARRPTDWNGTLLGKDDVHPTAGDPAAEPTPENLRSSGYLLRTWLTLRKLAEVKAAVFEGKR